MYYSAVLLVLLLQGIVCFAANPSCTPNRLFSGYQLNGFSLYEQVVADIEKCKNLCEGNELCQSVDFVSGISKCTLKGKGIDHAVQQASLVADPASDVVDCGPTPCRNADCVAQPVPEFSCRVGNTCHMVMVYPAASGMIFDGSYASSSCPTGGLIGNCVVGTVRNDLAEAVKDAKPFMPGLASGGAFVDSDGTTCLYVDLDSGEVKDTPCVGGVALSNAICRSWT